MIDFAKSDKYKILVVDDSRVSLTHLVQILQDEYTIHTAINGIEAIQIAKKIKPDLILTDVVMPQMDGYATISMLKEIHETKEIPIIFLTSLGQDSNEEKGLRLGAVDYIRKPYNPVIVKLRVGLQIKLLQQMRTIEKLSMADPFTELPNRHHFESRLEDEWKRAKKEGYEIGLLFVNIDGFKKYNSQNGYKKGDAVLLSVSEVVAASSIKPGDLTARWTEDGFAMLLINASIGDCNTTGEKLRNAVADLGEVTVSVGVNSVFPRSADCSIDEFITDTDSALYLAKELGRNLVVVAS